jgi:sugar phosphate permease
VLAIGTLTQAATASFLTGIALLLPELREEENLSLVGASIVVSAPGVGLMLTLIAFGAAADRYGERIVIATGVGASVVILAIATFVHGAVTLSIVFALAGAGCGGVNAASGRIVMGWFSVKERGLAMGMRQTSQPIGVAAAALALPPLGAHFSFHAALWFPTIWCAVMVVAVVLFVRDPPRPPPAPDGSRPASPYRGSSVLYRIHSASAILVVAQFTVATFTLTYLVGERHWSAVAAGQFIFAFQVAGGAGRILTGVWSDRIGQRLGPMRWIAFTAAVLMVALAIGAWTDSWWIVAVLGLASVVTVGSNGLAYVSVAEIAGSGWAGRALGVQNTGQNLVSLLTVPLVAAVIEGGGYGLAFIIVAFTALFAVPVTPVGYERAKRAELAEQVP